MRIAVTLVVLSLLLAGCSSSKDKDDDQTPDPVENLPPAAVIRVVVNGTAVDTAVAVPVDVGVNVTFDGSASTTTGGIFLWDLGDGSKSTTMNVTHAYAAGGLFNVTLTVGIGDTSATSSVSLNVSAPPPAAPMLLQSVPFSFSGNVPVSNPNAPGQDGVDYVDHPLAILDALDGTPAVAKAIRIALDGEGTTAVDSYLYWRSPDGTVLASQGSIGGGDLDHEVTYEESMGAGDYVVRVRLTVGADMDYTVSGEVDYYDF